MSAPTERLARLGEEAEALLAARRPVPVRELAQRHGVDEKVARDCVEALRVLTQAADPGEQAPSHGRCGPYELRGELGRGGMGVVYRAWHPELKRDVALKLLHVSARPSDTRVQRFVLEAQATARLRHPGVVGIHHAGWEAGRPYLVMDLVRGESLSVLLRRSGPLEPRRAAAVCRDVALVLEHVHRAGFLHRDVKPSNILVDADGRVLLTDFGLAKELDSERKLTLTGMIVGTPQYMPPEQISGEPLDARTDVYSLGVTLYTLLSGEPPFSGLSQFDLFTAICRAEPPPISSSRPDVPAALEAIALQCMAKDPEQRYPTARALADDLERWLEGESVVARPFRDRKRHRLWALLCAGLLCAGLLCAAALLAPTTPRPPSSATRPPPRPPPQEPPLPRNSPAATRPRSLLERLAVLVQGSSGKLRARFVDSGLLTFSAGTSNDAVVLWDASGRRIRSWSALEAPFPLVSQGTRRLFALTYRTGLRALPLDGGPVRPALALPSRSGGFVLAAAHASPDGALLLALGGSDPLELWSRSPRGSRRSVRLRWNGAELEALAFAPRGERLLVAGRGSGRRGLLSLYDAGGSLLAEHPFDAVCKAVAVSPQGDRFAVGTTSGGLYLGSLAAPSTPPSAVEVEARGRELAFSCAAHVGTTRAVAFSPDGSLLYSAACSERHDRRELGVWSTAERKLLREVELEFPPVSLDVSSDGSLLAVGEEEGRAELRAASPEKPGEDPPARHSRPPHEPTTGAEREGSPSRSARPGAAERRKASSPRDRLRGEGPRR